MLNNCIKFQTHHTLLFKQILYYLTKNKQKIDIVLTFAITYGGIGTQTFVSYLTT